MKHCLVPVFVVIAGLLSISSAHAQEELCDSSAEDCRAPLLNLINNERVGIDVGVWFFKDDRYVQALVKAKRRGVHVRVLMDTRANATYPTNAHELDQLKIAGIPMRRRTAGDILHWKLMIFVGQGVVEWSGGNFSPTAFVPQDPYKDYEDEVIYFSRQLLGSFMSVFDSIWTNTVDYANYANVVGTLTRAHPQFPIDARLNFPPKDSYLLYGVGHAHGSNPAARGRRVRRSDRPESRHVDLGVARIAPQRQEGLSGQRRIGCGRIDARPG
jgi:hypothetical protein